MAETISTNRRSALIGNQKIEIDIKVSGNEGHAFATERLITKAIDALLDSLRVGSSVVESNLSGFYRERVKD